jgi:hypothetical protein
VGSCGEQQQRQGRPAEPRHAGDHHGPRRAAASRRPTSSLPAAPLQRSACYRAIHTATPNRTVELGTVL